MEPAGWNCPTRKKTYVNRGQHARDIATTRRVILETVGHVFDENFTLGAFIGVRGNGGKLLCQRVLARCVPRCREGGIFGAPLEEKQDVDDRAYQRYHFPRVYVNQEVIPLRPIERWRRRRGGRPRPSGAGSGERRVKIVVGISVSALAGICSARWRRSRAHIVVVFVFDTTLLIICTV